jgi:hypothetical protein
LQAPPQWVFILDIQSIAHVASYVAERCGQKIFSQHQVSGLGVHGRRVCAPFGLSLEYLANTPVAPSGSWSRQNFDRFRIKPNACPSLIDVLILRELGNNLL